MRLVVTTYHRWSDATGTDHPMAVVADVEQLSDGCMSELCVLWHDATIADMARLGLDAEERVGAVEAVSERFFELEQADCRVSRVRQQLERVA